MLPMRPVSTPSRPATTVIHMACMGRGSESRLYLSSMLPMAKRLMTERKAME